MTGGILAFARAQERRRRCCSRPIGSQYFATNPTKPMASVPLVIYQNGIQAYPDLVRTAWGTALFLLVVVLC